MAQHNKLGKEGEQAACDFLIVKGMTIRETNWRMAPLEIDIVAQQDGVLHIVEVKTRSSALPQFDPLEAITPAKIRNLVRAANGYVCHYMLQMPVQFDVMVMIGKGPVFDIRFFPNAFQVPLSRRH